VGNLIPQGDDGAMLFGRWTVSGWIRCSVLAFQRRIY
jgi:hypothetical protein